MHEHFFKTFKDDWLSKMLDTGFKRFTTDYGMCGLAKYTGTTLDVLALSANTQGQGQMRTFIAKAKEEFERIVVRHDWNPIVGPALARYGFTEFKDGESAGWRWQKTP